MASIVRAAHVDAHASPPCACPLSLLTARVQGYIGAAFDPTCRRAALPALAVPARRGPVDVRCLAIQMVLTEHKLLHHEPLQPGGGAPDGYATHDVADLLCSLAREAERAARCIEHHGMHPAEAAVGGVVHAVTAALAQSCGPYICGDVFTMCDTVLFAYVLQWGSVAASPQATRRWRCLCKARPAARRVLRDHGITLSPWEGLPFDVLQTAAAFLHIRDVLQLQEVDRQCRRVAREVLARCLPVVAPMLPCEVRYDCWRLRVGHGALRISGRGHVAACEAGARYGNLAKLLTWVEGLLNPSPPYGATSPPGAPGGDRRSVAVSVVGPALLPAPPQLRQVNIDLSKCTLDQRTAALSLRNWLQVVEELPSTYPDPLDGLTLCHPPNIAFAPAAVKVHPEDDRDNTFFI
eukprot:TRINITY_DN13613_c0_g1_i1.p1 TRINITY_DN13613_c0_g1~~TRINITY_DN13613_c0_g1_i1.p1  ORF type:complete len:408 (+),score=106.32 TRINITY_DN13613_c0_g1_i1:95-1318(+)